MTRKRAHAGVFARWRNAPPSVTAPPELEPALRQTARRSASLNQHLAEEIPVIVPCFNTVTYVRAMVDQLLAVGLRNIILVDNASTYPPMLEYIADPGQGVRVVALAENLGPRNVVLDPLNYTMLPDVFCVTDPDLTFHEQMPPNFIAQLLAVSRHLKCGKVGLALDISDRDAMIQEDFLIGRPQKIWQHEEQFWRHPVHTLPGGDPVYTAEVDTTFALYNKAYFTPEPLAMFLRGVRVAGSFTCRHRPWYRDNGLPPEEETVYRATARDSFYLKQTFSQKTRSE